MKLMRKGSFLLAAVVICGVVSAGDEDKLWGWQISGGGNFGFGLKTKLTTSPTRAVNAVPGTRKGAAETHAKPTVGGDKVVYGQDAGGEWYLDPKSSWGEDPAFANETINWRLPSSAVDDPDNPSAFVFEQGDWAGVKPNSERNLNDTDRDVAYGASVELSHELWTAEEGNWGVDVAFGLTWMRANNCFRNRASAAIVQEGKVKTTIPADCLQDPYGSSEDDDTWGAAAYDGTNSGNGRYNDFIINLDNIVTEGMVGNEYDLYLRTVGDYEEWEISALLRPWYEVKDWLYVHGTLGVGVTRSSFDVMTEAIYNGKRIYRSSQEFHDWCVYGIAGAGLVMRAGDFDISCDGLFRFFQDDMEIRGRDVRGSIERPWAVLRVGLSYAF